MTFLIRKIFENSKYITNCHTRNFSSNKPKYLFELKKEVSQLFDDGIKYKNHPGMRHKPCVSLPYKLHFAAMSIINKYKNKRFRKDVDNIRNDFLEVFIENKELNSSPSNMSKRKISIDTDFMETKQTDNSLENVKAKNNRYNNYSHEILNHYQCTASMAARLPANYAALSYIFNEIKLEEPKFKPCNLFDFGSGYGTSIWAADEHWKDSINEYMCVDLNENMNELSRELLEKGTTYNGDILNKIFYRQFLPVKHKPMYDLVVSAFSLLEMPDTRSRIYTVENLWNKTAGMLVLVEHGSKAGFEAIMEARNFLLQISKKQLDPLKSLDSTTNIISNELTNAKGSVVAPCSHDQMCPRQTILQKKSYCNFAVNYNLLDYGQSVKGIKTEKFSYVVMKKNNIFNWTEEQKNWPRIVQPVINKTGHTICRVCANDGTLKEVILTKSNSPKHMYRCARRSSWGDKLPADLFQTNLTKHEDKEPTE